MDYMKIVLNKYMKTNGILIITMYVGKMIYIILQDLLKMKIICQ